MSASHATEQLRSELADLDRRLQRIERHLNIAPLPTGPPPVVSAPAAPDQRPAPPGASPAASPAAPPTARPVAPPVVSPGAAAPRAGHAASARGRDVFRLEKLIGVRVFAAAGALAFIVGLILFLMLAIDQGWFGGIPPVLRCLAGAGAGFVLLGLGELALRRINAGAAAGLSAAGVGAIYASVYAAHGVFDLIPVALTLVLMLGAVGIGFVVSARSRSVAVGVLSLIGGYLAAILLSVDEPSPIVFPAHALLMLALGLGLSAWRRDPFRPLRTIAWWATVLLGTIWFADYSDVGAQWTLLGPGFFVLAWALIHGELLYTSARGGIASVARTAPVSFWRAPLALARPYTTSFATTAWAVTLAAVDLDATVGLSPWLVTGAAAGVTAMLGMTLAGHLRALRDPPRTDRERLGASLLVQSGSLLAITLALALEPRTQSLAFLVLGVACVFAGRWIGSRGLDIYGLAALAIGTVRVLGLRWWDQPAAVSVAGVAFSSASFLVFVAGAVWIASASALRVGAVSEERDRGDVWRIVRHAAGAIGVVVAACALLHETADARSVGLLWAVAGLVALVSARPGMPVRADVAGIALALAGFAAWLVGIADGGWRVDSPPSGVLLSASPITGALISAALITMARFVPAWWGPAPARGARVLCACAGGLGVFMLTSLEIHHFFPGTSAVTIWWGLGAVGLIIGGFARGAALVRHIGLALLALAAARAVLIDTAAVEPIWRVAAFLGLGVLMLLVAVVYARVASRFGPTHAPPGAAP